MCERWSDFRNFVADMGHQPFVGAQLDRVDNDGPYHPSNCRWVSARENSNNTSANRRISFQGRNLTLREWAEQTGIAKDIIKSRLHIGWTIERALTQSPRRTRRK